MPSRLNSGLCLRCGNPLIAPWNDLQCCTQCTKFIGKELYQLQKRIERKEKKVHPTKGINSRQIMRQIKPIGVPVDGSFGFKVRS